MFGSDVSVTQQPFRACVDCRHLTRVREWGEGHSYNRRCSAGPRDPVDGAPVELCLRLRSENGACGPDAKLWRPRFRIRDLMKQIRWPRGVDHPAVGEDSRQKVSRQPVGLGPVSAEVGNEGEMTMAEASNVAEAKKLLDELPSFASRVEYAEWTLKAAHFLLSRYVESEAQAAASPTPTSIEDQLKPRGTL